MISARLESIFDLLVAPFDEAPERPVYAALPIPGYRSYLMGKDCDGHACLLIATAGAEGRLTPPIRLEKLDVQFALKCHLKRGTEAEQAGIFTAVRCRTLDRETVRYFLSVCDAIIGMMGDGPALRDVSTAVHRVAAIFQKIQNLPARTLNGLFGELYVICQSASPATALAAWRVDETARFDFSLGNLRLDVKTASGRVRAHGFSYEQCNPPPGTVAVVASMFVERVSIGLTLRVLLEQIEESASTFPDLIMKLHEVVAATLGTSLGEALGIAIDPKLAESSLRFYSLAEIPGIRSPLPIGVSDVHFRSDISACAALSPQALLDRDLSFEEFLPRGMRDMG